MQRRVEDVRDLTQRAFSNASKHETQQKVFETDSGIPVAETYLPQIPDELYKSKLGKPGEYPFTRGIYPTMYRERLWTMRQYTGFGSAKDTNIRFKYLLREGQTGLSVAFDLPTQLGLDSDSPLAEGEVGKVGVAISSLENMATLFSEIPIDRVSTSMTINSTASTMLAMYLTVAESRGIKRSVLRGTTQNDILKEYAARNTYIYPPEDSFHLCVDIIEFCAKEMPKWHPISIPHSRSWSKCCSGACVHICKCNRIRKRARFQRSVHRFFLPSAFILFRLSQRLFRGDCKVSSG